MTKRNNIPQADTNLFDQIVNNTPLQDKLEYSFHFDIASRVQEILDKKKMLQKDLAKLMDKKEAEISRWLSGRHNFTIKTIFEIQMALGEPIMMVEKEISAKREETTCIVENERHQDFFIVPHMFKAPSMIDGVISGCLPVSKRIDQFECRQFDRNLHNVFSHHSIVSKPAQKSIKTSFHLSKTSIQLDSIRSKMELMSYKSKGRDRVIWEKTEMHPER